MAVYTQVSESEAKALLSAYNIGELRELVGIKRGVENSNYFLTTTTARYLLTLYEKRVQEKDLPFFLGLMEHLAGKNIPCPVPLKTRTGAMLARLAGRPAAITSFLKGDSTPRISPRECSEVGRMMAKLHLAAADFTLVRANALSFPDWEKLVATAKPRADEVMSGLGAILQSEIDYLRLRWPNDLPRGIIHGDMFPDNIFFDRESLCGVIDFYFSCNEMLAYDLAIVLNAWCFETSGAFNITKAQTLMKSYESVRPLSASEKRMLPLLARGSALRFLLTRLHDWLNVPPDALVKPLDPLAYLTRLQFHQMVGSVAAYGLDV